MSNGLQLFRKGSLPLDMVHPHFAKSSMRKHTLLSSLATGRLPTLAEIADSEYLLGVADYMRTHNGPAPGPDGIDWHSVSRSDLAQHLRVVSEAIGNGTYTPHPIRIVPIPKSNGKVRKLSIRNITDRVVSGALNLAMTPFLEQVFHPRSMGFRPHLGTWTLLAKLEQEIVEQDRPIVAVDDVRNAFPSVNIDLAMDYHRRLIHDERLLAFIEAELRGAALNTIGIEQGSPYSPSALNVCLHYAHDLGLNQGHSPVLPWYRYADNLAYLCQDSAEGHQVLAQVNDLLSGAGFTLKGDPGMPIDLRKEEVQLLGYRLRIKGTKLVYLPGEAAWDQLEQDLVEVYKLPQPAMAAQQVVHGWLDSLGPTFENLRDDTFNRVLEICARLGHREIGNPRDLKSWIRESWKRWQTYRKKVQAASMDSLGYPVGRKGVAAPPATIAASGL